ncbi:MAG: lipocalin-like domain-containing protein [Mycobacterium sp.]
MSGTLREAVLGAWELVSFVARDAATGEDRHPLGTAPIGLILYTVDGHKSAQLADSGMKGYISYGGRFSVDEETSTLRHHVTMSMMPELLTQVQFRHAGIHGEILTLSATRTDDAGMTTHSRLQWKRSAPTPNHPPASTA